MRNKYHAVRTRGFASKAEADYCAELQLREKAGDIRDLTLQPRVRLANAVFYKPDFSVVELPSERLVYIEVKGFEGERWRLIQQLWQVDGPAPLQVVKRGKRGFIVAKEILPHGA